MGDIASPISVEAQFPEEFKPLKYLGSVTQDSLPRFPWKYIQNGKSCTKATCSAGEGLRYHVPNCLLCQACPHAQWISIVLWHALC